MTEDTTQTDTAEALEASGVEMVAWLEREFVTLGGQFAAKLKEFGDRVEASPLSDGLKLALLNAVVARMDGISGKFQSAMEGE